MANIEDAISVALTAHKGQRDKGGRPYILHPLSVMMEMKTELEQIVAVLHDVVEDAPAFPLEKLRTMGFSEDVLAALNCLTKREGESYDDFIDRVRENDVAKRVKLADLDHNMDPSRLYEITATDRVRLDKYRLAREKLLAE